MAEAQNKEEDSEPQPKLFDPTNYNTADFQPVDTIDRVKLSQKDKEILRETWKLISDELGAHGINIFKRIFEVSPAIQGVFLLDGLSSEELDNHPKLAKHSRQFLDAIEYAVLHLDDMYLESNSVDRAFVGLGRHHIHFKGLLDKHFDVFTGSILYVLGETLGEQFTPETRKVWRHLLDHLIQHIKHGWHLEKEKKGLQ